METILAVDDNDELGARLFSGFPFDRSWVMDSIRDKRYTLYVDQPTHPSAGLLQDCRGGFSFISGSVQNDSFVENVLDVVKNAQWPLISLPSLEWRSYLIARHGDVLREIKRVDYEMAVTLSPDILQWRAHVPDGVSVLPIDESYACEIGRTVDPDFRVVWPDPQQFVQEGMGFCAVQAGEVLSYAVSAFPLGDTMAIGTATRETHRCRGMATLCLAALVEECTRRGISLEYTTGVNNLPSRSVARKTGFVNARHHFWVAVK